MKKYFQKVYDETHIKPFTFLNCFLCVFVPVIAIIIGSGQESVTTMVLGTVVGLGINLLLQIKNFQGKGVGIFFLNILASLAFVWKLILWPMLKVMWRFGSDAVVGANTGDWTGVDNATRKAEAELSKTKLSAFNWFEYNGYKWEDAEGYEPELVKSKGYTEQEEIYAKANGYYNAAAANQQGFNTKEANYAGIDYTKKKTY